MLSTLRRAALAALTPAVFACLAAGGAAPAQADGKPILLTALGDSVVAGLHSGFNCVTDMPIPAAACAKGQNFVDDLARMLNTIVPTTYQNLGSAGSRVVTVPLLQVPRMSPDTTVAVLFVGRTDELQVAQVPKPDGYSLAQFEEDFLYATAAIKLRAPHARLIVATFTNRVYLPNFLPGRLGHFDPVTEPKVARANIAMNRFIAASGYEVVDLRCEPALYDPVMFAFGDEFHPNDAGYAIMAIRFFDVISGRTKGVARPSCPPYTQVP